MPRPKIKIFWDLVTCPVSRSYRSIGEALKDIRSFTSNFGVVTNIKAYWDRNKMRHVDDTLRVAMPSMGVNLVDCSSMQGYTSDALAKMLSVDIVVSAMDDPMTEDDIILVISGDKSVLYPISLLMFRNYTVFLVVPDDDADTQLFQATRVFSWYRDVLGCNLSPEPATVSIPETFKSPVNGWIINGTHVPQLNLDSPSVERSPSSAISPRSEQSTHTSLPKLTAVVTSTVTSRSKDRSIPPPKPSYSRAPSVLSLDSDPHTASKSLVNFKTIASERHENINTSALEFSRTRPKPSVPTPQISPPQTSNPTQNEDPNEWAKDDWTAAGGWNEGGSWETAGLNWLSEAAPASAQSKETPRKVVSPKQETKSPAQKKPQAQDRDSGSTRENKVPSRKNEVKTPSNRDPPLSVFNPLVEVLRSSEKETMMRCQLGEHLAKRKGLYQSAGVSGFGEFIALATKKNIVTILGVDNHQQVKLKKN